MATFQVYNKRIGAWVKMEKKGKHSIIKNVKQKDPGKPFKAVPKKIGGKK